MRVLPYSISFLFLLLQGVEERRRNVDPIDWIVLGIFVISA